MSGKKLNYLYEHGLTVNFDDKDKIVFISDIHRGDGTFSDSLFPNRNIYITALKYYFRNNFIYVEVGDSDELWKNKNFCEISYIYEDVFKVLNKFKDKNKIYCIYGNHDYAKKNKSFLRKEENSLRKLGTDYGRSFLNFINNMQFYEGINFLYKPIGEKFLVTHGHQLDLLNDEFKFVSKILVRYIWKFLNGIAGFRDPASSAKSNTKRSRIDIKLQQWSRENGKMLICGHTHNSRFPDLYEPAYFNDGCCVLPYTMTAIEIEHGNIALIKWTIDADENGFLQVKRKYIVEPKPISVHLLWAKEERMRLLRQRENL